MRRAAIGRAEALGNTDGASFIAPAGVIHGAILPAKRTDDATFEVAFIRIGGGLADHAACFVLPPPTVAIRVFSGGCAVNRAV